MTLDKPVAVRRVRPVGVKKPSHHDQIQAVNDQCGAYRRILPQQPGRKWEQRNAHQEENIDPEEPSIGAADIVILIVVYPIDTQHDEADNVGKESRPKPDQFVVQAQWRRLRWSGQLDVKHHQRQGDGKDPIRQRLDSRLAEASARTRIVHNELRLRPH